MHEISPQSWYLSRSRPDPTTCNIMSTPWVPENANTPAPQIMSHCACKYRDPITKEASCKKAGVDSNYGFCMDHRQKRPEMKEEAQCRICKRWFVSARGLSIHFRQACGKHLPQGAPSSPSIVQSVPFGAPNPAYALRYLNPVAMPASTPSSPVATPVAEQPVSAVQPEPRHRRPITDAECDEEVLAPRPKKSATRVTPEVEDDTLFLMEPDHTINPMYRECRSGHTVANFKTKSIPPSRSFAEPKKTVRSVTYAEKGLFFTDSSSRYLPGFVDERDGAGKRSMYLLYGVYTMMSACSLTISWLKHDVPKAYLDVIFAFMKNFAIAGIASLEIGGNHKFLHIQCTMILHGVTCKGCENMVKQHLSYWFDFWTNTGHHVSLTWLDESKDVRPRRQLHVH